MDLPELLRLLDLKTFVAIDFETTGLDFSRDKIIECAVVRFEDGVNVDSYSTLVNPGFPIPSNIINLTNITNKMVSDAPTEDQVVKELVSFIGNYPLVAHNIEFDYTFLENLKSTYLYESPTVENTCYDTLLLAQTFLFFLSNHRLKTVAEYFGLSGEGAHRAEADTVNVGTIFVQLVAEAASYPLETIQKMLTVIKDFSIPTKELFINLANIYLEKQLLNKGLLVSSIPKKFNSNVVDFKGRNSSFPDKAMKVFGKGGHLDQLMRKNERIESPYEERPTQIKYSELISKLFTDKSIGILEAGTGLGKSVAYLFPALKFGLEVEGKEGPTIISCHTKHLQDQLFYRELPLIADALDISFKAVMMKGRRNYLCITRLNWIIEDARNLLSSREALSILPIIVWLKFTKTGNLSECPGFLNRQIPRLKSMIDSDKGFCTQQVCNLHQGCFIGPLRKQCHKADIIVVNHSLLLSELSNPGILPEFNRVIVDEAHNLVKVGYNHFQSSVSYQSIRDALRMLNPKTRMGVKFKRQVTELGQKNSEIVHHFDRLNEDIENVLNSSEIFFKTMIDIKGGLFKENVHYKQKVRYQSFYEEFELLSPDLDNLSKALYSCISQIKTFGKLVREIESKQDIEEMILFLDNTLEILSESFQVLTNTALDEREDWVYWYEGYFKKSELILSLNCTPIDIGVNLSEHLFDTLESVVLTSATLSIGHKFDYYINRVGLADYHEKSVITAKFPSPFLYAEQCRYFQYGGSVGPNSNQFYFVIADLIEYLHNNMNKRMMILFTARILLEKTYEEIVNRGLLRKMSIFPQFGATSRSSLLDGFRESTGGILLGTNSFWEGVDLPRELLEILVITKLPFDVPSEPIVAAYGEKLAAEGKNSFMEYTVPETAIKLIQGFGRLIRSMHDEGIFVNLDHRVVNKQYGYAFQNAIPVPMKIFQSVEEIFIS